MLWTADPHLSRRISRLISSLNLSYIDPSRVHCFQSTGSSSRATARIWSLPAIWQQALHVKAGYCLEIISEKFTKLSLDDQDRVLIHELLHIPKTFSGALVPHRSRAHGRRSFRHYHDQVETLFTMLRNHQGLY